MPSSKMGRREVTVLGCGSPRSTVLELSPGLACWFTQFVPSHCTKHAFTMITGLDRSYATIWHAEPKAPSKTVGARTAQLVNALYESGQTTFTHADVESITGLSARSLIRHVVARGVVSRLEPSLFVLVPPELGRATEFAGNPYIIVRQLAAGAEYFISHASAMELHRMVTQLQFVIITSTTKRLRKRTIHGGHGPQGVPVYSRPR